MEGRLPAPLSGVVRGRGSRVCVCGGGGGGGHARRGRQLGGPARGGAYQDQGAGRGY